MREPRKYQGPLMPCREKRCSNCPPRYGELNGHFQGAHDYRLQSYQPNYHGLFTLESSASTSSSLS